MKIDKSNGQSPNFELVHFKLSDLSKIAQFSNLENIVLDKSKLPDLKFVSELKKLKNLSLKESDISLSLCTLVDCNQHSNIWIYHQQIFLWDLVNMRISISCKV